MGVAGTRPCCARCLHAWCALRDQRARCQHTPGPLFTPTQPRFIPTHPPHPTQPTSTHLDAALLVPVHLLICLFSLHVLRRCGHREGVQALAAAAALGNGFAAAACGAGSRGRPAARHATGTCKGSKLPCTRFSWGSLFQWNSFLGSRCRRHRQSSVARLQRPSSCSVASQWLNAVATVAANLPCRGHQRSASAQEGLGAGFWQAACTRNQQPLCSFAITRLPMCQYVAVGVGKVSS